MTHLFRFFSLNYIISITSFKLSLLVQNHIQIQKYFQNLRGRSYDSLFFNLVLLLLFFFRWNVNAWLKFMTKTFPSAFFFVWLFFLFLFGFILFLFHTSSNYKLHKPLLQTWSDTTKYYFQEMRVEQGRQIGKKYRKNTNQTQTEFAKLYT